MMKIENNVLVEYKGEEKEVVVPEGIKIIGESVFENSSIEYVKLPSTLLKISENAFKNSALKEITVPEGVEELEKNAFFGCHALNIINLPSTLKTIGRFTFQFCDEFETLIIPEGVEKIDLYAFYGCLNIKKISFPSTLKEIGNHAFSGCKRLTEIIIPEGVIKIESEAFKQCINLRSVHLPHTLKCIGYGAFNDTPLLEEIVVPKDVLPFVLHDFREYTQRIRVKDPQVRSGISFISNKKILLEYLQSVTSKYPDERNWLFDDMRIRRVMFSLEEDKNTLTICNYNIKKAMFTSCEVMPKRYGSVIVDADEIMSIVQNLPEGDLIFEADERNVVTIRCGEQRITVMGFPPDAFYYETNLIVKNSFEISHSLMKDILVSTLYATEIGCEDNIHAGERFEIDKDSLTVVSANGYRLALREIKDGISNNEASFSFVVPKGALMELNDHLLDSNEKLQVELTENYMIVRMNNYILFSRLLEGKYFNYRKALETQNPISVRISKKALEEGILRIKPIKYGRITFSFKENTLTISDTDKPLEHKEEVLIEKSGDDIEIVFNNQFILDALEVCKGDELQLLLFTPWKALIIKPISYSNSDSCLHLIMPMNKTKLQLVIENDVLMQCNCQADEIIIPEGVKVIGEKAFDDFHDFSHITFPESLTSIEKYAFGYCENLTDVILPDSVTEIGEEAFQGCFSFKEIIIPDGVTEIKADTFSCCTNLSQVTLPNGVTGIGESAFYGCGKLEKINIPTGVTVIGKNAFCNCESLKEIDIPSSVTEIGESAFEGCKNLEKITIPEGVTSIGNYGFSHCDNLKNIVIPKSVDHIGESPFLDCKSLINVEVDPNNNEYTSKDDMLFNKDFTELLWCSACKQGECVLPNGVAKIDWGAFKNCSGISSIVIPDSVTEIGGAFRECIGIRNIVIPKSVTKIGGGAFYNCTNLSNVILSDGVKDVYFQAFANCASLKDITIPDSVTFIHFNAFDGCNNFTIHAPMGSYAEQYAKKHGIVFEAIL